jgi:hypothetical protein
LDDNEEWDKEYVEKNQIVVKFQCKGLKVAEEKITIPPKKPKINT